MRLRAVALEQRCVGVDRRCRESERKAKIEGYMSISDEEAHHRTLGTNLKMPPCGGLQNDMPRMQQRSMELEI